MFSLSNQLSLWVHVLWLARKSRLEADHAATAVSAGFLMESMNYALTDYLTRPISTAK